MIATEKTPDASIGWLLSESVGVFVGAVALCLIGRAAVAFPKGGQGVVAVVHGGSGNTLVQLQQAALQGCDTCWLETFGQPRPPGP